MAAGFLRKTEGAVGQTMEVLFYSVGCASGRPHSAGCVSGGSHSAGCVPVRPSWSDGQIRIEWVPSWLVLGLLKDSMGRQDTLKVLQVSTESRNEVRSRQWAQRTTRHPTCLCSFFLSLIFYWEFTISSFMIWVFILVVVPRVF